MISILNLLFPLLLSFTSPAPAPASHTLTVAAASQYGCPCTIPMKDWGK